MRDQQIMHVVGMFFLGAQDALEHGTGARIVVAEIADQLAVMIHRDAFGHQIFLDHVHQVFALDILRDGTREQPFRIEIGLAAKLVDALGHLKGMLMFFLGVDGEFLFDALAGNTGGSDGMHGIAQYADQLGGQHRLQHLDGLVHITDIIAADGAIIEVLCANGRARTSMMAPSAAIMSGMLKRPSRCCSRCLPPSWSAYCAIPCIPSLPPVFPAKASKRNSPSTPRKSMSMPFRWPSASTSLAASPISIRKGCSRVPSRNMSRAKTWWT